MSLVLPQYFLGLFFNTSPPTPHRFTTLPLHSNPIGVIHSILNGISVKTIILTRTLSANVSLPVYSKNVTHHVYRTWHDLLDRPDILAIEVFLLLTGAVFAGFLIYGCYIYYFTPRMWIASNGDSPTFNRYFRLSSNNDYLLQDLQRITSENNIILHESIYEWSNVYEFPLSELENVTDFFS